MLRTDLPDHRRANENDLVAALRGRDPLALAEAYHRTIPAAHASARRLLPTSTEVEALLRAVYDELWQQPPDTTPLEGWVRRRTFDLAVEDLRERGAAPASPSLTALLPDLPRPEVRYLDAVERALAELSDDERLALLLAHDRGVPTSAQELPHAERALVTALTALAGPDPSGDAAPVEGCDDVSGLADWVLGLLPSDRAEELAQVVGSRPDCAGRVKALRRGRRRLEGLPPTPDMGQRVLVVVLAGAAEAETRSSDHGAAVAALAAATPAVGDPELPSALDAGDGATPGRLRPASDEDTGDLADAASPQASTDADQSGTDATASTARAGATVEGDAAPAAADGEEAPAAGTGTREPPEQEQSRRDDDPEATAAYAALADLDDPSPATTASPPGNVSVRDGSGAGVDRGADPESVDHRTHEHADGGVAVDRDVEEAGYADHDAYARPGDDDYDGEPAGPSAGRRFARGLLFILFLAAGVALGLFIGVRYLPQLLDRLS